MSLHSFSWQAPSKAAKQYKTQAVLTKDQLPHARLLPCCAVVVESNTAIQARNIENDSNNNDDDSDSNDD